MKTLSLPLTLATLLLAAPASAAEPPERPAAIVRVGVGLPNLLSIQAEAFITQSWSIEAGAGVGLLPSTLTLGTRWTPKSTCWLGCWEGHSLRLSPGLTWYAFPSQMSDGLLTLNGDLAWFYRSERGIGVSAGLRGGLGMAYGRSEDRFKPELGLELYPLLLGVVF